MTNFTESPTDYEFDIDIYCDIVINYYIYGLKKRNERQSSVNEFEEEASNIGNTISQCDITILLQRTTIRKLYGNCYEHL